MIALYFMDPSTFGLGPNDDPFLPSPWNLGFLKERSKKMCVANSNHGKSNIRPTAFIFRSLYFCRDPTKATALPSRPRAVLRISFPLWCQLLVPLP